MQHSSLAVLAEPAPPRAAALAGDEAAGSRSVVQAVAAPEPTPHAAVPIWQIAARILAQPDWIGLLRCWGVRLLSLIAGVLLWHLACKYNFKFFIKFENVPPPLTVFDAFVGHLHDSKFYIHIMVSIQRILISFGLAAFVGIVLGMLMGRSRTIRDLIIPYIEVLRPIPAVAWIPLAILMWPTEESSIVYITFLGALFPIILNTVHGVEQTPEVLVRAAQTLGASRMQIFWHVVMPAALPSIATGLAIGMGVAWFSLLAGEIISGQYGIGYFTWSAYSPHQVPGHRGRHADHRNARDAVDHAGAQAHATAALVAEESAMRHPSQPPKEALPC